MIRVFVNGDEHELPDAATLAQLVERLGRVPGHVATAVNGEFVARAARAAHTLADGDRVQCFQPIGGG
jgi:sulfur carrier protein